MSQLEICPCGSENTYNDCCNIIHQDLQKATTAEELMRARYTAYVTYNIDFIYNTYHTSTRGYQNKKEIENWAKECKWMFLEIVKSKLNTVEFKAHYVDGTMNTYVHHEKSTFKQVQDKWYYVDGVILS
jgi:SEC-C motif-containing protein